MQNNQNPLQNLSNQDLENMYPDLFNKIMPQIELIASELRDQNVSDNMIDSIVDEILRRGGLDYEEDMDDDMEYDDAIAVQRGFNYPYGRGPRYNLLPNRSPYYRRRRRTPRYYGNTLQDLVRILLLRQIGGYRPYY